LPYSAQKHFQYHQTAIATLTLPTKPGIFDLFLLMAYSTRKDIGGGSKLTVS